MLQLTGPDKYSLNGLTPRRSHVRRGDHMYPRAITSCPGHALCLTCWVKCTCSGDHIRAWCQELQRFAWYCNSWNQARMWSPLHVHLTCQVRHRACPGQDVIARGYMWSPRRTCDRRGVRPSRLNLEKGALIMISRVYLLHYLWLWNLLFLNNNRTLI